MIKALSYGAPPHGGMAPGIDRIVMILADETNIREVTLFPMNQNAEDLLMGAPSNINNNQLKELNIKISEKEKKRERGSGEAVFFVLLRDRLGRAF